VRRREKTGVIAVLHIFAVCLQNAGRSSGLRKHFAQHGEIEAKRIPKAETFREASRVDVHHHVNQRFHFRGLSRLSDVTQRRAQFLQDRFRAPEVFFAPAAH
jgi:hypothetical protein